MNKLLAELFKLSPAERIQLAEDLWDSVAAEPADLQPFSETQRAEIERRLAEHERDLGNSVEGNSCTLVVAHGMTRPILFWPEAEAELIEAAD